jgi:hypothetical protein
LRDFCGIAFLEGSGDAANEALFAEDDDDAIATSAGEPFALFAAADASSELCVWGS